MRYTLWADGSLLGESNLELGSPQPGSSVGAFRPTDAGLALLPSFLEFMTAGLAIGPMLRREGITQERLGDALGQAVYEALHRTPEGQRTQAAQAAIDALHLELRDSDGAVVPTKQITIQDCSQMIPGFGELPPEAQLTAEAAGFSRYLLCAIVETTA